MDITGTVKKRKGPYGRTRDWFVYTLDGGEVVTGNLPDLLPGDRVQVFGRMRKTKYGRQLAADRAVLLLPRDSAGVARYLAARFRWIGPEVARSIVGRFGPEPEDIFKALDSGPMVLTEIPGLSPARADDIYNTWKLIRDRRKADLFLSEHQIGPGLLRRLRAEYQTDDAGLVAMIAADPYKLVEVGGVGFKTADRIGQSLEITGNDPRRVLAGIRHVMNTAAAEGHVFLPRNRLDDLVENLLADGDMRMSFPELWGYVNQEHAIIDGRAYIPELYRAECRIARELKRIMSARTPFNAVPVTTTELDSDQRRAVRMATEEGEPVVIIDGGPGTGKTFTLSKILEAYPAGKAVLAAPTGKAAQKMAAATGREASTIHRLLEYHPERGFQRNRSNPLDGDLFVIDETSMIDVHLMSALLAAIPDHARVVFLGDDGQLPSVGPGAVLRDMLRSGAVPCATLTTLHRQAADSLISKNAERIRRGDSILPGDPGADFNFIQMDDPEKIVGRILSEAAAFSPWEVQVLSPQKKGPLGTEELNKRLREVFNHTGRTIPGTRFKLNDRIIQTKNDYELEVFNGDVGAICAEVGGELLIEFADGGVVRYPRKALGDLDLSYCLTIHKSQGSEFPVVLMVLHRSHYMLLRRDLLYTGITRAKERCTLVGTMEAVNRAISTATAGERHTSLNERIREAFELETEMEETTA